jgi:hypothetical protein
VRDASESVLTFTGSEAARDTSGTHRQYRDFGYVLRLRFIWGVKNSDFSASSRAKYIDLTCIHNAFKKIYWLIALFGASWLHMSQSKRTVAA